jgi:hypothetical protein
VRAPLVEAEQDGSIRIQDLTKVVMVRRCLGLAEKRLVPFEAAGNVAHADDRPCAFHRISAVGLTLNGQEAPFSDLTFAKGLPSASATRRLRVLSLAAAWQSIRSTTSVCLHRDAHFRSESVGQCLLVLVASRHSDTGTNLQPGSVNQFFSDSIPVRIGGTLSSPSRERSPYRNTGRLARCPKEIDDERSPNAAGFD